MIYFLSFTIDKNEKKWCHGDFEQTWSNAEKVFQQYGMFQVCIVYSVVFRDREGVQYHTRHYYAVVDVARSI